MTPGRSGTNLSKWSRLDAGDAVFFYGQKQLYLAGRIAAPFRNAALAERLWGRTSDGFTWELMFALTGLRGITVPVKEVREALGWSANAFVQGFTVVEGTRTENLGELVNMDEDSTPLSPVERRLKEAIERHSSPPDGPTDGTRTGSWRREHSAFKQRLIELAGHTRALCGAELPSTFLVAAHIKK